MAKRYDLQLDFSGGEVSRRVLMREDADMHSKSVLRMLNMVPTLQGTAVRSPGTRYVYPIVDQVTQEPEAVARIIPFITSNNERAIVELTPATYDDQGDLILAGDVRVIPNITASTESETTSQNDVLVDTVVWRTINENWQCDGQNPWRWAAYNNNGGQQSSAFTIEENFFKIRSQLYKSGDDTHKVPVWVETPFLITEDSTVLQIVPSIHYEKGTSNDPLDYDGRVMVTDIPVAGNDPDSIPAANLIYTNEITIGPGQTWAEVQNVPGSNDVPTFLAGTTYYTSIYLQNDSSSNNTEIQWNMERFRVNSRVTIQNLITDLVEACPYSADELPDVQYVQSPYTESVNPDVSSSGKQLVLVHPNHGPRQLYYDGGAYIFDEVFTDESTQFYPKAVWESQGFPAACTSYNGRLVLGGSRISPTLGSASGSNTETVWATEVGLWYQFTDPNAVDGEGDPIPISAQDSVEFTTIYRSPIKWLIGQKQLLIGAESMEYTSSSETLFQPGDLGVFMQSTHGSSNVQPVGMGQYVLFSADAGRKIRSMKYIAEDEGWVAPDMTLLHPNLFESGIVRMVRLRNPHQTVVVVMGNGSVALFHQDTYSGIQGWSRMNVSGDVKDACVLTDSQGLDVLYLSVLRQVNTEQQLMVEAIANWTELGAEIFTNSSAVGVNVPPSNVLAGLEHLDEFQLQVVADGTYYGLHDVNGGQIVLTDDTGEPINVSNWAAGIPSTAQLATLPLITQDPGSKKRYTSITVRTLDSSRPIINGERPADRDPVSPMDISQPLDIIYDNQVAVLGTDETQEITIEEDTPMRLEVIGIFGKVKESSL